MTLSLRDRALAWREHRAVFVHAVTRAVAISRRGIMYQDRFTGRYNAITWRGAIAVTGGDSVGQALDWLTPRKMT